MCGGVGKLSENSCDFKFVHGIFDHIISAVTSDLQSQFTHSPHRRNSLMPPPSLVVGDSEDDSDSDVGIQTLDSNPAVSFAQSSGKLRRSRSRLPPLAIAVDEEDDVAQTKPAFAEAGEADDKKVGVFADNPFLSGTVTCMMCLSSSLYTRVHARGVCFCAWCS